MPLAMHHESIERCEKANEMNADQTMISVGGILVFILLCCAVKLNTKQFVVLVVSTSLCILWCGAVTPWFGPLGHQWTYINSRVIAAWIIGCIPIIGVAFLLLKKFKKK